MTCFRARPASPFTEEDPVGFMKIDLLEADVIVRVLLAIFDYSFHSITDTAKENLILAVAKQFKD